MSRIDERIASLKFEDNNFKGKVTSTIGALTKLREALSFDGGTKGFDDINKAAGKLNFSNIETALSSITSKFSLFGVVGFQVIQNLTNSAMAFGSKMLSQVLDPLIQGGRNRALNIEQAKFQFKGLGMDIEASMADALYAVKGTAFGLDEAARAAAQFGASGIKSGDEMRSALRGIAGVAAMAGTSYSEMADVFTKVAGQGRLMGDDLNRLGARGINAAATLGNAFGKTEAEIRDMVSKGQISFEMFSKAMSDAFGEHATSASETFTGAMSNMHAALARIGQMHFTPYLERQKDIFNALTPKIDEAAAALKPLIETWEALARIRVDNLIGFINGLNVEGVGVALAPLSQIMQNVFTGVLQLAGSLKDAFKDIFPGSMIPQLIDFVKWLERLSEVFILSEETAAKFQRVFAGVFAVFSIGWQLISAVVNSLAKLFPSLGSASSGLLDVAARVGDFLVQIDRAVKQGDLFNAAFSKVSDVISEIRQRLDQVSPALSAFIEFMKDLFEAIRNVDTSEAGSFFEKLHARLEPLKALGQAVMDIFSSLWELFTSLLPGLTGLATSVGDVIESIAEKLSGFIENFNFEQAIDIANLGGLGVILVLLRNFVQGFQNLTDSGSGFIDSVKGMFDGVTGSLEAMQARLKADALIKIAGAIGILAASIFLLSMIDSDDLQRSLLGITAMFVQLGVALAVFENISQGPGLKNLPILAAALTALATAILILSVSVLILSNLEWDELLRGLTGVTVLLGGLAGAARLMSGHTKGLFTAGAGMLVIAAAINILVSAVKDLAQLNLGDLAKGLGGVLTLLMSISLFLKTANLDGMGLFKGLGILLLATSIKVLASAVSQFAEMDIGSMIQGLSAIVVILAALAGFSKVTADTKGMLSMAVSMTILGAAMLIFAEAVDRFGSMSLEELGKGLLGMGGALAIVAGALRLMPKNMLVTSAGMVIVGAALNLIADAVRNMGGMTWDEIARGLVTLAGALTIIAVAMMFMNGSLAGAAATLVVAAALRVLAPVLQTLGEMSWGEIAKGLVVLAAVFVIFGAAGLLLAPVTPVLLGLSAAIALFGIGLALAGAGVLAFSVGLTGIAAALAVSGTAIVIFVTQIISLLPFAARKLGEAIIEFTKVIIEAGPLWRDAMVVVIGGLIEAIVILTPMVVQALVDLLNQLLTILADNVPNMVQAGLDLLIGILDGIRSRMYEMTTTGIAIIVEFLNGVADKIDDVVIAGMDVLIAVLNGIASKVGELIPAGINVVVAFIDGMTGQLDRVHTAGMNFLLSVLSGISDRIWQLVDAGVEVVKEFLSGIANEAGELANAGAQMITDLLWAVSGAINDNSAEFREAAASIGWAIVDGATFGLYSKINDLAIAAADMAQRAINSAKNALNSKSPSKKFIQIGKDIVLGAKKGVDENSHLAEEATATMAQNIIEAMSKTIGDIQSISDAEFEFNPVVKPIVDLSNVESGVTNLNGMFSRSSIAIAPTLGRIQELNNTIGRTESVQQQVATEQTTHVNFTQNINAPKSPSRLDVYRDTKNLLSSFREELSKP